MQKTLSAAFAALLLISPLSFAENNTDTLPEGTEQLISVRADTPLKQSEYKLKLNTAADSPYQDGELSVSFLHPENLPESFIAAGDSIVIGFTDEAGIFALNLTLTPLNAEQQKELEDFENLKKLLTARFSDKDNMLFGEYEISNEVNKPAYKELTLTGFLKKQADGILPELFTGFTERTLIEKGVRSTLSCEVRGSHAAAEISGAYFKHIRKLCDSALDSYRQTFESDLK